VLEPHTTPILYSIKLYPYLDRAHRRAKAERESRLKAMQTRARKGLLNEDEKVILAAEEKEAAEKKGDCVVM